jgi:hypothetical protein
MSSFDLNDEIMYKAKYLKYKNKYINLKIEQEGGEYNDGKTYIIFYNASNIPKMGELIILHNIQIQNRKLQTPCHIEWNLINGLPNIYKYKIPKNATKINIKDRVINPMLILNIDDQIKLKRYLNSTNTIYAKIMSKIDKLHNTDTLVQNLKTHVKSYEESKITIEKSDIDEMGSFTVDNIDDYCKKMIIVINRQNNSISSQFMNIYNEYKKAFQSTSVPLFTPSAWGTQDEICKSSGNTIGFNITGIDSNDSEKKNGSVSIVDSYIIVRNFNKDHSGLHFTIYSIGKSGIPTQETSQPEQETNSI